MPQVQNRSLPSHAALFPSAQPGARRLRLAGAAERRLTAGGWLLAALLVAIPVGAAAQQQLYRWVDDQGNVHYSDVMPPTEVEKGREELSPQGLRVRTVPPAKTPEEIERERELERLRAQQQRMLEQQRADDRVLLNTFQNVDDLIMTRDGNLSDIDTLIQFKKTNIRRHQEWLAELRADAADLERSGHPVPAQLAARIASTERAIADSLASIIEREQQKQEIRRKFDRDLKRLRQLKNVPATAEPQGAVATRPPLLENLVECGDAATCEQLWQRALAYVQRHATTRLESIGKDVAMTAAPTEREDIALTVSRIWRKDGSGASIFLDVQCRSYAPGQQDACRTDARSEVLKGFRAALQAEPQPDAGGVSRQP
jgi:hypothetical protein